MSILRLAFYGLAWLVIGSPSVTAATNNNASTIHFKSRADSLIILPVKVNGAGPYRFLLDTGTSETVVDAELTDQLKLPIAGAQAAAMIGRSAILLTAHAGKLEVADAMVSDLDLLVVPKGGILSHYPGARGILGEDFLRNFDLLLDYRHHLLQLEQGPALIGRGLAEHHVPVESHGNYEGGSNHNRLILQVSVRELGARDLTFQLDSGASSPILFMSAYRELRGTGPPVNALADLLSIGLKRVAGLFVGDVLLSNVTVLISTESSVPDLDGLLPTSLFQSVFISHSGGYAIFNPVSKSSGHP